MRFMRHDFGEIDAGSKVVPQGFYIMLKDIDFSYFTGPADLDINSLSGSEMSRIPYEEGSGTLRHIYNS